MLLRVLRADRTHIAMHTHTYTHGRWERIKSQRQYRTRPPDLTTLVHETVTATKIKQHK